MKLQIVWCCTETILRAFQNSQRICDKGNALNRKVNDRKVRTEFIRTVGRYLQFDVISSEKAKEEQNRW